MQQGMLLPPTGGRERSSSSPPGASRAGRACEKCTRTKKKCDKGLPACSRCTRLATKCVYDFVLAPPATTMVEQPIYYVRGSEEMRFNLLDPRNEVSAAQIHSVLTNYDIDWRDAVARYFQTLHPWFAIIQNDCFQRKLDPWQGAGAAHTVSTPGSSTSSNSGAALGEETFGDGSRRANPAEMALLLLCMHLATQWAETVENRAMLSSPAYLTAKRVFGLLRSYSRPSVELVQCGLLLAVYEHGHGDVMRGYVTLSECVGMGRVLGVRPGKFNDETLNLEDVEEEQLRALYWGLYVWDKISHVHCSDHHLPLLMDLPANDDLLPTSNYIWDPATRQYFSMTIRASVSEPVSTPLGGFQRSCQAVVLLAKGLNLYQNGSADDPATVEVFAELDLDARRLIEAMVLQASRSDEFAESFAMCLSLLFILYSGYLLSIDPCLISPTTTNVNILKAIAGLNFAIRLITDSTTDLDLGNGSETLLSTSPPQQHHNHNMTTSTPISTSLTPHRRVSAPSCAHAVLHAACSTHAFANIIPDAHARLSILRDALVLISRRWAVAATLGEELDAFVDGTGPGSIGPMLGGGDSRRSFTKMTRKRYVESFEVRNVSGVHVRIGEEQEEEEVGRRSSLVDEGYGSWGGGCLGQGSSIPNSPLGGDHSPTSADGGCWNGMEWSVNLG